MGNEDVLSGQDFPGLMGSVPEIISSAFGCDNSRRIIATPYGMILGDSSADQCSCKTQA
jgi:hypothetical protein